LLSTAAFGSEFPVELTRVATHDRRHLRGEEAKDDPVFVGGPHRTVVAEE